MNAPGTVLVVDDDAAVGKVLATLLQHAGHVGEHVASSAEALRRLEAGAADVVLTDLQMPGMDGMALLREVGRRWPGLPVIVLTAHGSVPAAVEAMKAGAVDFMLKPFDKDELLYVVNKALVASRHLADRDRDVAAAGAGLVGDSPAMREALAVVRKVAPGTATVLVRGETGTGKELVARAVHEASPRRDRPLVTVNCAALPDALLEAELFGYEKGAFTGANARKPGRLELAHGGTLFLDEIGDVSHDVQVKLLRVLQERTFERVGGTQTLKVDVRFIAATHRDLEAMVASGQFREDLFYRLNVIPIRVPPLRERAGDVERLARHFCAELGQANGRPRAAFTEDALAALAGQPWPGNVRQLRNLVERLVVLSDAERIGCAEVDRELAGPLPLARESASEEGGISLDARRRVAERAALDRALVRAKNNRTLAARLLGVSRRTLYNKLREHGIE